MKTGGLLRERGLLAARAAFDAAAAAEVWHGLGIAPRIGDELRISLFCYDNAALPDFLRCWSAGPARVHVLAAPGAATEQIGAWFGKALAPEMSVHNNSLTVSPLPFLPQARFDSLLWACDVNFVRGEDSFVRAQWAQRPFVWQIYPQKENAHLVKLDAFLTRHLDGFADAEVVRRLWHAWNGGGDISAAWRDYSASRLSIERHGKVWAADLDRMPDLTDNLTRFARER